MQQVKINGKLIADRGIPLQAKTIEVDGDVITGLNNYRISFQLTGVTGDIEILEVE